MSICIDTQWRFSWIIGLQIYEEIAKGYFQFLTKIRRKSYVIEIRVDALFLVQGSISQYSIFPSNTISSHNLKTGNLAKYQNMDFPFNI